MKTLICVLLLAGCASAQIVNNGAAATPNPTSGVVPINNSGTLVDSVIKPGATAPKGTVLCGDGTNDVSCNPGIHTSLAHTGHEGDASISYSCALDDTGDGNAVVIRNSSSAMTDTVPATGASCPDGRVIFVDNLGTGTITLSGGYSGSIYPGEKAKLHVTTLSGTAAWEKDESFSGTINAARLAATPGPGTTCAVGSPHVLTGPREYFFGTTATDCYVTPPTPAAGYEFCVRTDNNVSANIHLNAIASVYYEKPDRTGYGTVNTAMASATATVTNQICIEGRDATHYAVMSHTGDFTAP